MYVLSCLLGHPPPFNFNDIIYGRPFGRGEGLECMQTAWYVLDIKMSDSLFPSSLSTPHCSAGVNRGISNSLGRNSCFITETVGGRVYRLDIKLLLFKICIHLFRNLCKFWFLGKNMLHKIFVRGHSTTTWTRRGEGGSAKSPRLFDKAGNRYLGLTVQR